MLTLSLTSSPYSSGYMFHVFRPFSKVVPGQSCGVTNAFAMLDPTKINSWQSSAQFQCKSTHNEEYFEEAMEKLEEIKCSKEGVEFCQNLKSKTSLIVMFTNGVSPCLYGITPV